MLVRKYRSVTSGVTAVLLHLFALHSLFDALVQLDCDSIHLIDGMFLAADCSRGIVKQD